MSGSSARPSLAAHRVLVPGGTGGVGEGVVRAYLEAGADVVVPTRSAARAEEFRRVLGDAATGHLHLVQHDYPSFAGAEQLAAEMERRLGGIDDVVVPIGGFWGGRRLWEIEERDWDAAFVEPATTHMAVLRACVPRLSASGTYTVVVGESAQIPVPTSGLVSMEQAALAMMRRVLAEELGAGHRVFTLVLGPIRTRLTDGLPDWVEAAQVGRVAVAVSAAEIGSREISLRNQDELARALAGFEDARPVVASSTMVPAAGRQAELIALLAELATRIRAEPGCLDYSVYRPHGGGEGALLIVMKFSSMEAFAAHSTRIAEQVPRLAALLDTPPSPPMLYEPALSFQVGTHELVP